MSNEKTPEKQPCFIPLIGENCPAICAGRLAAKFIRDPNGGEGFSIQVCPNPETLGSSNSEADYCGDGANVIIMHRDTVPTEEEYAKAVRNFGW